MEWYRASVLEQYNQDVQQYIATLKDYDKSLEIERSQGTVPAPTYDEQHKKIEGELKKTLASKDLKGEYMQPYFRYLEKYKSTLNWANGEIARKEREGLTT